MKTVDLVQQALLWWFVATVTVGVVALAMRVPSVTLALAGSVIGVPFGVLAAASMDWLEFEEIPLGGAIGASVGLIVGGAIGLLGSKRIVPRPSARVLGFASASVLVAGGIATWMGSRALDACWRDPNCHFPLIPALVFIDAAILALVVAVVAVRTADGAGRPDLAAAAPGTTWFLLSGFVAGCVVLWSIGLTMQLPSFGSPILILGAASMVGAFSLKRRHPTIALVLLMAVAGSGIGAVAASLLGGAEWGIVAGAVVGSVAAAAVAPLLLRGASVVAFET